MRSQYASLLAVFALFGVGCEPRVNVQDDGGVEPVEDAQTGPVTPCLGALTQCGDVCADTRVDPEHCGACGETCGASGFCCEGVCVAQCEAPTEACGGSCVNTRTDSEHCGGCDVKCGAEQRCSEGACTTCASEVVDASQLPAVIELDTRRRGDLTKGSCAQGAAAEYAVTFTAPHTGVFEFSTDGSSFNTVLYVLDGSCAGRELACNDDAQAGTLSSWLAVSLESGQSVVVVVDGYEGQEGAAKLQVVDGNPMQCCSFKDEPGCIARSVEQCVCEKDSFCCTDAWDATCVALMLAEGCGACVESDRCEPTDLAHDVSLEVRASLAHAVDAVWASCGALARPEALFRYRAPEQGVYTFDTSGTSFDTVLAVLGESCDGEQLACNDDAPTGAHSQLSLVLAKEQTVLIAAEAFAGDVGELVMHVSGIGVPELDPACPALPLPTSLLPRIITGSTERGSDVLEPSCTVGGYEQLYTFLAPATGNYFFDTAGSSVDTTVLVREGGCSGSDLACSDMNELAGTYHGYVELALTEGQLVTVGVDTPLTGAFVLSYGAVGDDPGLEESPTCCSEHTTAGCKDPAVEACVCEADPACCAVEGAGWDLICVMAAQRCGATCD
jgi:hypothetical protein